MENPADEEPLELAPLDPPAPALPRIARPAPAAPASLAEGSPGERPKKLEYRSLPPGAPRGADTETIKNLYMPMWLLAGGVVVEIIAAFFTSPRPSAAISQIGIDLIVNTVVLLIALVIAAKLRGIDLGNFGAAVFKLSALAIAPRALETMLTLPLSYVPFGSLILLVAVFIFYFALLGALFDLDESDTWYCLGAIIITELALMVAVRYLA